MIASRQSGPVRMAREVVRLDGSPVGSQLGFGITLRVTLFASL